MPPAIKAALLGGIKTSPANTLRGRVLNVSERKQLEALRVVFANLCK